MQQSLENTMARVLELRKRRMELLDEFYGLGDRLHKLLEFQVRYSAAGIGVFGAPGPIRDWDREKDVVERVHAKARHLSEERRKLLPQINAIEEEIDTLPFVRDDDEYS